jgi:hypothetical protein
VLDFEPHSGTKQGSVWGLPIGFTSYLRPHSACIHPADIEMMQGTGPDEPKSASCNLCKKRVSLCLEKQQDRPVACLFIYSNPHMPAEDSGIGFRTQGLINVVLDLHRCARRTKSDKNRQRFRKDIESYLDILAYGVEH